MYNTAFHHVSFLFINSYTCFRWETIAASVNYYNLFFLCLNIYLMMKTSNSLKAHHICCDFLVT